MEIKENTLDVLKSFENSVSDSSKHLMVKFDNFNKLDNLISAFIDE